MNPLRSKSRRARTKLHRSAARKTLSAIAAGLVTLAAFAPVASAAEATVSITDTLTPRDLTVGVGDTVIWSNNDSDRHRMRTTSGPVEFDSGNLESGQNFAFTFNREGTYLYVDDRDRDNSSYYGTIIVTTSVGDPEEPPPPPPPTGDVTIVDDTFQPGSMTVSAGGTVTWANLDREHTVTALDRSWDSGIFDAGQSYSRTFPNPGTIEYFCIIHPDMVGTIVVMGDGGTPPPPEDPPPPPPPPTDPPPAPNPGDVSIVDNDFLPGTMSVSVGSTVSWVNTGALPHTVTTPGQFDSGIMMSGDTWNRTFNSPGTFNYLCTLHPEMTGTIVVTDGTGTPPPPEDPPPPPPPPTDPPPAPNPGDVSIVDNDFLPGTMSVSVGSTVSWVNTGALPHTVTTPGQFDSGIMMSGDTWNRTFNSPGTFNYLCTLHPEMTGTIVVTDGTGTPPPPEDPPPPPPPPTDPPPAPLGAINVIDNDYQPRSRTITVGSTVSWVNTGALPHTVTTPGQFDSGIMMSGDTWNRTFNSPGTFNYLCTLHPEMTGTIVVTDGTGAVTQSTGGEGADLPARILSLVDRSGESDERSRGDVVVDMIDNAYDPLEVEVQAGSSVTWSNIGDLPHTVTAGDESFDSGFLMTGENWTMQFDQVGVIDYFCIIHPEMAGRVTVVEATQAVDDGGAISDGTAAGASGSETNPAGGSPSAGTAPTTRNFALLAGNVATLLLVMLAVGFVVFLVRDSRISVAPDPDAT